MADGDAPVLDLVVNGKRARAWATPFATLADVLRDHLGLTGTKIGCDAGDCGACTVLLDGAQVCACLVPAAQCEGRRVETVEGAGPGGITDKLRHAFLAHGAAQCGLARLGNANIGCKGQPVTMARARCERSRHRSDQAPRAVRGRPSAG